MALVVNPWRVEAATSHEQLETVLNDLDADGYYIPFVLTEGPRDGFAFTIIAKQRRTSGNSEAPPLLAHQGPEPRDLVAPKPLRETRKTPRA